MSYGISREEEYKLPEFESHTEARLYFKEKYGTDFQIVDSFMVDGQKLYCYKLILDREAYYDMVAQLEVKGYVGLNERYMFSSQDIQIFEDGHIHIVH